MRSLQITTGNSPYTNIAVVGLGKISVSDDDGVNVQKDNVRHAVAGMVAITSLYKKN